MHSTSDQYSKLLSYVYTSFIIKAQLRTEGCQASNLLRCPWGGGGHKNLHMNIQVCYTGMWKQGANDCRKI